MNTKLTANDINAMNYNELIGLTRETNRTPGGLETIKHVSHSLMLSEQSKILDIGTSTGHTAIEFSRLLNCNVIGIDINQMSLEIARKRCEQLGLFKTSFVHGDATNMPFADNTFDVVFSGNVTSLIDDKTKAMNEYRRVLKQTGYLVAVPMYYIETPSEELLNAVRDAIQVNIAVHDKADWRAFFVSENVEVFDEIDYRFEKCTDAEIEAFCTNILSREHLKSLDKYAKQVLNEKYIKYMHLFNENLSHMGYTIFILRERESQIFNDPQLYYSKRI